MDHELAYNTRGDQLARGRIVSESENGGGAIPIIVILR